MGDSLAEDISRVLGGESPPARKELQRVAKLAGIKANGKSVLIIEELKKFLVAEKENSSSSVADEPLQAEEEAVPMELDADVVEEAVPSSSSSSSRDEDASEEKVSMEEDRKKALLLARSQRSVRKALEVRQAKKIGGVTSMAHHRSGAKNVDRPTAPTRPLSILN